MKVALVTNIPAPYRVPTWNLVGNQLGNDFLVIFCSRTEPNRKWDTEPLTFNHVFLKENTRAKTDGTTFVHNNPDVWKQLRQFNPDVVITGGFNPTMLYAFLYTVIFRKKHIAVSDAWEMSERHLSFAHRMVRKLVFSGTGAFLPCSEKGKAYYQKYGAAEERIFISHYSIDTKKFTGSKPFAERKYDLLFAGQLVARKNPQFFVDLAVKLRSRVDNLRVLVLGDGPLKAEILDQLTKNQIPFSFPGHASQAELPGYYADSKIFIFPTEYDAWGVVAQEALASGTPVIVTNNAGCADELVVNGKNGYVVPLTDAENWLASCSKLLNQQELWNSFSENAVSAAAKISSERSAKAIIEACRFVINQ